MLGLKRVREHAALFASLTGVIAIVTALGVGLPAYLADSADHGVRAELQSVAGDQATLQLAMALEPDPDLQDRIVRDVISEVLPVPLQVDRTAASIIGLVIEHIGDGDEVTAPQPDPGRADVRTIPFLEERASLVEGAWPRSPEEASVQADAAGLLGIEPGDRIGIADAELTVTGTWRVDDGLDPRWSGELLMSTGVDGDDIGPIVIAEEAWSELGVDPRVRWTLLPVADEFTTAHLEATVAGWKNISDALSDAESLDAWPISLDNDLVRTAQDVLSRVSALRAVQPVALLVVAAIALLALIELARLLSGVRAVETELLWSRGATPARIAANTAAEAALAALLGSAIGTATGLFALGMLFGGPVASTGVDVATWAVPLTAIAATGLVFATIQFLAARRPLQRDTSLVSGRSRTVAALGAVVLVTVAAAIAMWQLLLYGSPLTPAAGGGVTVDPIAVLAPALALVAIVLLGLAQFPPVAAMLERAARRRDGLRGVLATRSMGRRLQLAAAPIVLLALAAGQIVIAAGYSATWSYSFDQARELRSGASVRILTDSQSLDPVLVDRIGGLPEVATVAPVTDDALALGTGFATAIGITPAGILETALPAHGAFDRQAVASALSLELTGPVVPAGADGIRVVASTVGFSTPPAVLATFVDDLGARVEVLLDSVDPGEASVEYSAELVPRPVDLRLVALDVLFDPSVELGDDASFVLESFAEASGNPLETGKAWIAFGEEGSARPLAAAGGSLGFTARPDQPHVRMVPSFDDKPTDYITYPIVLSGALADRYDLVVGDVIPVGIVESGLGVPSRVTAITPAIPGARSDVAFMIDSRLLVSAALRSGLDPPEPPRQFWLSAEDPVEAASVLRLELPVNVRLEALAIAPGRDILAAAVVALWIGAAGATLLAFIAIGAVVGSQLRARRHEVVILRAVGLGSAELGAVRRRELAIVLGYGMLVGLVAGLVVTLLAVGPIARAAVPDAVRVLLTFLRFDWAVLGLSVLAVCGALLAVIGWYGARVAAQARRAPDREDVQ